MKLVILGGGGFRVPLVYEAVATRAVGDVPISDIVLFDESATRLDAIMRVISGRAAELPRPEEAPRVTVTTDLDEALVGADFVFAAVRVGGAQARTIDERVALDLGLLGQETVGPGGLAYALRTIPVMRDIARAIARIAPNAWTINFTNPAGIVTQVMREVLGDRVVGICDTPIGLVRRVSRVLGASLDDERVDYDYVGLNHLGWLRSVAVDGVDRLPGLLADDAALDHIEEARLIGKDWVRATGALPNEYLYYYWHTADAIEHIRASGETRGTWLARQQGAFYDAVADPCCDSPLAVWRSSLSERESTYMAEARDDERRPEDVAGGGYQEVALRLMSALATGVPARMILDVGNGDIVPALPSETVIEVGCDVGADGIRPRAVAPVGLADLGLMARLRASETAIADAALTGNLDRAWEGFSNHPLVDSPTLGRQLLAGYLTNSPAVARVFGLDPANT